jgi:hypothetical protein
MIQTREEFKYWINTNFNGVDSLADSALWIPENDMAGQCEWFVHVGRVDTGKTISKFNYWQWCHSNLQGLTRCFYSDTDNDRECWGFTDYDDIPIWLLRWGR